MSVFHSHNVMYHLRTTSFSLADHIFSVTILCLAYVNEALFFSMHAFPLHLTINCQLVGEISGRVGNPKLVQRDPKQESVGSLLLDLGGNGCS